MKYINTSILIELILSKYGKFSEFCKANDFDFGSILRVLAAEETLSHSDYKKILKALDLEINEEGLFNWQKVMI